MASAIIAGIPTLIVYVLAGKYFIRGFLYLLILNIKKSMTNFIKLTANIRYFFDLRSSSKK